MDFKNIAMFKHCCEKIGLQTFGDLKNFVQNHGKNSNNLLYNLIIHALRV